MISGFIRAVCVCACSRLVSFHVFPYILTLNPEQEGSGFEAKEFRSSTEQYLGPHNSIGNC